MNFNINGTLQITMGTLENVIENLYWELKAAHVTNDGKYKYD